MSSTCPCPPEQIAVAVPDKPPEKKHVYLVLDDWEKGYSIHRVGWDEFHSNADDATPRLATSPLVRVEAQNRLPHSSSHFAGHGTKIFAMWPPHYSPGIPVFDVDTLAMSVCPHAPRLFKFRPPMYVSVGERLLAFADPFVQVLGPEPPPPPPANGAYYDPHRPLPMWSWACAERDAPPMSSPVICHALHPDGKTVFMSVPGWHDDPAHRATFTFDVDRLEWAHLGNWILPFRGQAHYDRKLNAWVGIRCKKDYGDESYGRRVCCCDVPPADVWRDTAPNWKLGVDVFEHPGMALLYQGDSRFCKLQRRHDQDDCLVMMTSFVLEYDEEGNLRADGDQWAYASISYKPAREFSRYNLAFWM